MEMKESTPGQSATMETPTWGPSPGRDAPQDSTQRVSLATRDLRSPRASSPSMGRLARNIAKAYGSPGSSKLKQVKQATQQDFDTRSQRSNSMSTIFSTTSEYTLWPSSEHGDTSQVFNAPFGWDTAECATLVDTRSCSTTTLNTLPEFASSSTTRPALPFHSHQPGLSRLERRISYHPYKSLRASSPRPRFQPQKLKDIIQQKYVPSPEEQEEANLQEEAELHRRKLKEEERRNFIFEAHDWIREELKNHDRWRCHLDQIRIICDLTWPELQVAGYFPQEKGVDKCRKLIRVPVIHDEIALFLWTQLAAKAERGPNFNRDKCAEVEAGQRRDRVRELFEMFDKRWCHEILIEHKPSELNDSPTEPDDERFRCKLPLGDPFTPPMTPLAPKYPAQRAQEDFAYTPSGAANCRAGSRPRSRASSQSRDPGQPRKGNLAERLGVAVGGFGSRIGGVLGESMSHGYGQQPRQYRGRMNSV